MPAAASTRLPGRPREFDAELALERALEVFRERGYGGASIALLGQAMGLTTGSIYKAYGDKRALFLEAFERYVQARAADLRQRLETRRSGRERIAATIDFYLEFSQGIEGLRGCLVAGSAAEARTLDTSMQAIVADALRRNQAQLEELVRQGQADGSVPSRLVPGHAAQALLAFLLGLRVLGKAGHSLHGDALRGLALKILD
ncbi:TetR/AcrR family transcriptional regulator [[Pseudomonas] boreopolis]|uniref:TetR/AcrR family transcriptional regulator n=1 Tax=Xanthomonas boreopolis TaxID=86183 RepID=UPI003D5B3282